MWLTSYQWKYNSFAILFLVYHRTNDLPISKYFCSLCFKTIIFLHFLLSIALENCMKHFCFKIEVENVKNFLKMAFDLEPCIKLKTRLRKKVFQPRHLNKILGFISNLINWSLCNIQTNVYIKWFWFFLKDKTERCYSKSLKNVLNKLLS